MIEPFQRSGLGCALAGVKRHPLELDDLTLGLQESRSRRPPWKRILRLVRFGRGRSPAEIESAIRGLRDLADGGGVLRVHVEGWSEDPATLETLACSCEEAGFSPASPPRTYRHTLWIDLGPDEEEILLSFHTSGRRNIRDPAKKGFEVRHITNRSAAPRIEQLHRLSFARTGGDPPRIDWTRAIAASAERPERIRLVGLFDAETGEDDPLGFAMGFHHGDVAEYAFAGSMRPERANVSVLYAPTWELMRWAKTQGARWWDFGGIPSPKKGAEDDPRSGIADFKRYFGGEAVEVGAEWIYEPRGSLGKLWPT